jgi:hypothetical protein
MTLQRIKDRVKQILTEPDGAGAPPPAEAPDYLKEFADRAVEFERVYAMRKTYAVPVDQPLVLVSQVQRSGGTLMSQLFDGHPQCFAHPHELYIGKPEKWDYPDLNLTASPETWIEQLYEKPTLKHFRSGYQKFPDSAQYDKEDVFPCPTCSASCSCTPSPTPRSKPSATC